MADEIGKRTDRLTDLIEEVAFAKVQLIDIDAWTTGHIVSIINELDAELQRRYDEHSSAQSSGLHSRLH